MEYLLNKVKGKIVLITDIEKITVTWNYMEDKTSGFSCHEGDIRRLRQFVRAIRFTIDKEDTHQIESTPTC